MQLVPALFLGISFLEYFAFTTCDKNIHLWKLCAKLKQFILITLSLYILRI